MRTTDYGLRTNGTDIKHGLKEAIKCLKSQFNVRLQNSMTTLTPFIKMNFIYQKDPIPGAYTFVFQLLAKSAT